MLLSLMCLMGYLQYPTHTIPWYPPNLSQAESTAEMSAPRFRPCPQCGVRVPRVAGGAPVPESSTWAGSSLEWVTVPISWDNNNFFFISCYVSDLRMVTSKCAAAGGTSEPKSTKIQSWLLNAARNSKGSMPWRIRSTCRIFPISVPSIFLHEGFLKWGYPKSPWVSISILYKSWSNVLDDLGCPGSPILRTLHMFQVSPFFSNGSGLAPGIAAGDGWAQWWLQHGAADPPGMGECLAQIGMTKLVEPVIRQVKAVFRKKKLEKY